MEGRGRGEREREREFSQIMEIGQYSFEIVRKLTYMRTLITSDNNRSVEIKKRLAKADKTYFSLPL